MAKKKEKSENDLVKESLLEQLKQKGADVPLLTDRINAYMELWKVENALQKDIEERGVVYTETGAAGQNVTKNNVSVKDLVSVSRQMLSILKELNLTTESVGGADVGEY